MNKIKTAFIFYNNLNHLSMKDESFFNDDSIKMCKEPALFDCLQDFSTHGISSFNTQLRKSTK